MVHCTLKDVIDNVYLKSCNTDLMTKIIRNERYGYHDNPVSR
jgi:hypothetical protein